MLKYLQDKFALSESGAKDLVRGSLYSALGNISMMFPVGLFILMLDELLQPLLKNNVSSTPNVMKYVLLVIVVFAILYGCQILQYSSVFISTYTESATRRITLAEKLRQLPLSFFGKRDLSDLTNTIMGDCTALEHAFSHAIPQLIGAIISTTIITIGLLCMDWRMGLAVLWVVPVALIMIVGSKSIQNKMGLKHYKAKRACAEGIQECLETIQDIKACNMEDGYIKGLDKKLDEAEKAQINSELILGACVTSSQAILRLGLASVVLVGSRLLIQGQTDLLTYFIFLITASRLYDPLSGTLANIAEVFSVEIPTKRMQKIESQSVQTGAKDYNTNGYDIKFDHVAFSYNSNEPVLKDVSFVAKQGEVTALVGPSGGGKSTAAKLAARFWDVNSGKITLGGKDITSIDPEALLKNYAIVFQDVTLFNGTVMENIRLGKQDATDKEVRQAAKIAMCDDFILKMPKGYDTVIGENGSILSGGERQRISIARAILKDAPIILLDEATASLDVENETQIQTALTELVKNKTVLIIAHRMRTVANADKIVVLADGYVSEQGKPEELLKQKGLYRHMVEIQNESMEWSL
ncbi:putative multidrug export ATP-binding/permease protein [Clostridium acetireducens DSM 10703]|uniref:Putative multidrug export ATP-binding/permease protein n=1 Tax=Clostridium acetireducens DSM 10703 TaxID=1121290 RepID=A0A1E8EZY9_9CLOT|nr:ABC transporter ATP-binding protein [Clostridium acetireducens]OFI06730.1 putative multidrug export ATP-binding/permease protein [Clostridium acetireducens DSM 10703]